MERKTVDGRIRNKERTKLRLINAVGDVIRFHGYTKLGVNIIARSAGVDKKLIYRYFGNVNDLIKSYLMSNDYWLGLSAEVWDSMGLESSDKGKKITSSILKGLFNHLSGSPELQNFILWEISENNPVMREIGRIKEFTRKKLLVVTEKAFANTDVDISAVSAIIVGGIYYLQLRAKAIGGTVFKIDAKSTEGKDRIVGAVEMIVDLVYKEAVRQQNELASQSHKS